MNTLKKIVVYILALVGLVSLVKHIRISHCREGCCLCNAFKTKVEGSRTKTEEFKAKTEGFKSKAEGLKTRVEGLKTKMHGSRTQEEGKEERKEEGEKRTGTRYGSSPIRY